MNDSESTSDPDDQRAAEIRARSRIEGGISNADMSFLVLLAAKQGQHATYLGVAPRQGIADIAASMENRKVLQKQRDC